MQLASSEREHAVDAQQSCGLAGAHQDRDSFVGERAQQREDAIALEQVDVLGRLVDHEQRGLGGQRLRERDPCCFRAVELSDPLLCVVLGAGAL